MRSKLSSGRIYKTVHHWSMFAQWPADRGITQLSAVTQDDLTEFAYYLGKTRSLARNTVQSHLITLSRLHRFGARFLPGTQQLVEPPWMTEGVDDYLPAASSKGENGYEPISPDDGALCWSGPCGLSRTSPVTS
ncbi:hypothetical protein [Streptomyces sp. NRRL F-2664]|uniref:hypothetical protein n=1 Tax=Streptomyces sp. NRRL F-2664 TaxID=1463842 RepID=UPI00068DA69A|nr:hypothetical protein [Streptomyces sp. NRRL F-2664]